MLSKWYWNFSKTSHHLALIREHFKRPTIVWSLANFFVCVWCEMLVSESTNRIHKNPLISNCPNWCFLVFFFYLNLASFVTKLRNLSHLIAPHHTHNWSWIFNLLVHVKSMQQIFNNWAQMNATAPEKFVNFHQLIILHQFNDKKSTHKKEAEKYLNSWLHY